MRRKREYSQAEKVEFIFHNYSRPILDECAEKFRQRFSKHNADTRGWTDEVLKWFDDAKQKDVRVFCHPEDSEFIFDLCHTTFPENVSGIEPRWTRWERAIESGKCQLLLALECEWGKYKNPGLSLAMILDDAWKLAVCRAYIKVMIFASQNGSDRDKIFRLLKQLRCCNHEDAPWLCIDVPWGIGKSSVKIDHQIFDEKCVKKT